MIVSQITISSDGPTFSRIARGLASSTRWGIGAAEMMDMIIACLDMGITTFDNAAIYGGGEADCSCIGATETNNPPVTLRLEVTP